LIHIGVDPGNAGAIAVINTLTKEIQFFDTPTVQVKSGKKFKNHMDPHAASLILQAFDDTNGLLVTIEKVAPMPNFKGPNGPQAMGVTSAFTFGMGYGMWIGICAASLIPYQLVHPATWKSKLLRDMGKEKDASRVKAMQLYPQTAKDLTRKKDHGRGDALLLAHYGLLFGAPATPVLEVEEMEPTLF